MIVLEIFGLINQLLTKNVKWLFLWTYTKLCKFGRIRSVNLTIFFKIFSNSSKKAVLAGLMVSTHSGDLALGFKFINKQTGKLGGKLQ